MCFKKLIMSTLFININITYIDNNQQLFTIVLNFILV